jgi:hypothetical protein
MGPSPRWLRGSCYRSCPPEAAAPCVVRRDQAGVPSQSMPLLLSHCRASPDRSGEGDGLTLRPVIRTPPFAPTWTALSSPCSRMRRSKSGGHLSRTRRPQSGQTHSSSPDSAWPLRIISCVSRTDVTYLGIRDNLGHSTQPNASSPRTQQPTPLPGLKRLRRAVSCRRDCPRATSPSLSASLAVLSRAGRWVGTSRSRVSSRGSAWIVAAVPSQRFWSR